VSDTPRTDAAYAASTGAGIYELFKESQDIERELNAANERIKLLEAVTNDPHALWANWLRGTVALPAGIGDVRQYQDRIKRLEEGGDAMFLRSTRVGRKIWRKAKEAKL
jgi:hypothetical protein